MAMICLTLPRFATSTRSDRRTSEEPRSGPLGLAVLLRFPAVAVLSLLTLGVLLAFGAAEVLYAVYSRTALTAGASGYGFLLSATGVGGLLGIVVGVSLFGGLPPGRRLGAVLVSGAPPFAALAVVTELPLAVLLAGLASFAWGPYYVLERSLVQRLVPDDARGRVFGARLALSSWGFPVGAAIGGAVLAAAGARPMVLGLAGTFLGLGLLALLAPPLRRLAVSPQEAVGAR
jgi:MFS family permease